MAGIFYKGSIDGTVPAYKDVIIKGSATVYKGSFGNFADANLVEGADAGERIGFYIQDIVTKNGFPIAEAESSELDGTYTAGAEGVGNYAAAADNATDKQVKAKGFFPRPGIDLFSSVPDATLGTTTGSDSLGYYTDLTNSYIVDEDTASTSAAQLAIVGIDPLDTTKGLYTVAESHFIR